MVLAIPPLLLSLALITALGFGSTNIAIAVGAASASSFARVMRSETMRVRRATYVEAARSVGTRWWVSLARHVLPNAARPVLVLAVLEFDVRSGRGARPYVTPEQARARVWTDAERAAVVDRVDTQIVGSPATVVRQLDTLARVTGADELVVTTITTEHADRVRSTELLAEAWATHRVAA